MTKKKAAILALIVIVFAALYLFFSRPVALPLSDTKSDAPKPNFSRADHKTWICPMHPEITQDYPGTCPICGMKLVEANGSITHEHGIHVDNATIQRLGVRLARTKRGMIAQDLQAYGNVIVNEKTLHSVHSKYDGWIKKLYVHSVGENVKAGQVLYEIYSPDLIARERSYLSSMDRRKQVVQTINSPPGFENEYVMDLLVDATKDRVRLNDEEGVSLETIQLIEDSKQVVDVAKIAASNSGVVTQLNVREGAYIMSSTALLTLDDVSRVWVDVSLYPDQIGSIRVGDLVTLHTPDGQTIKVKLDFINPLAENNKVGARMEIDNSRLHLRPGSFVDVTIHAHPHEALVVPSSAVLRTGDGNVVMLHREAGHFLPVYVETGIENGDLIEIIDGLQPGAEVAVNGQFLLDSAASMNATIERMQSHEHIEPEMHDAK
jgi:membrane fusion protein, copper/silver efflux system